MTKRTLSKPVKIVADEGDSWDFMSFDASPNSASPNEIMITNGQTQMNHVPFLTVHVQKVNLNRKLYVLHDYDYSTGFLLNGIFHDGKCVEKVKGREVEMSDCTTICCLQYRWPNIATTKFCYILSCHIDIFRSVTILLWETADLF